jgi:hypothetical protein
MNRFKKYKIEHAEKTIQQAFAQNVYPGNNDLLRSQCGHPEEIELLTTFTDKNWQEISLKNLEDCDYYLAFFSKNALHYYLPAFMIITLKHYDNPKAEKIVTSTISTLIPSMRKHNLGIRERWIERTVKGLTQEQMEAITLFLETIVDVYDDWPVEALEHFWSKYSLNKQET